MSSTTTSPSASQLASPFSISCCSRIGDADCNRGERISGAATTFGWLFGWLVSPIDLICCFLSLVFSSKNSIARIFFRIRLCENAHCTAFAVGVVDVGRADELCFCLLASFIFFLLCSCW